MTREVAQDRRHWFNNGETGEEFLTSFHEADLIKHIDKIYDDFESRTCESCEHYKAKNKQCINEASIAFTAQEAIYIDDGCNKWESKIE